ncbi:flagellar basal body P-ring protein FlgI [Vitreimonas flagellata]|uniref:flagellar basal body P-ring protein FlgI n=1 Tax=Vitreimonas flagellata TaxID=2560861 RepID=UPI0010757D1D|nr:flagellar basal body P-ring protein FlgI [Vitreimonas flagellata]
MMHALFRFIFCWALAIAAITPAHAQETQIKGLGRFEGWRENALIGYGIVVGLAGSGDSPRSVVTRQALSNVYARLGAVISEADVASRNVAVVVVIASLPASANVGDRISVTVSSTADARSLAGGTLLMTPLVGPDGRPYALAQGAIITGGDSFESQLNLSQRNYPTTGRVDGGATVEREVNANLIGADGRLGFLLNDPNFTTASRIAAAINDRHGRIAEVIGADEIRIAFQPGDQDLAYFVSSLENLAIAPDRTPRVVINERTGTIVAGGDVMISSVVVSQGDIRVTVTAETQASQPSFIDGFAGGIRSLVITNTDLDVERGGNDVVARFPNTSVADLVQGLSRARVDTRRIISILQAVRAAGALHAEIIVQ